MSPLGTGIEFRMSSARKRLEPPPGGPIIAHVVVNVEYWPFDEPLPRGILPGPHGSSTVPDIPNFGWAEYGLRCGLPRIMELLSSRGVPASASLNAGIIAAYPEVADAVVAAGWDIVAHGVVQRSVATEDDEAATIERARDLIAELTGKAPRGWLGPGLQQTPRTPALLAGLGFDHVCDWGLDDLPVWIETPVGRLIAVPYSLELNDSLLHAVERHSSDELFRRLTTTLGVFESEVASAGSRIVTLGLHPHLIGVPHRITHLARSIDLLLERDDVVFMTASGIADWYAASGD